MKECRASSDGDIREERLECRSLMIKFKVQTRRRRLSSAGYPGHWIFISKFFDFSASGAGVFAYATGRLE